MRQVITFTMKPEDYAALKARALALGISMAAFIKRAVAAEMARAAKTEIK